MEQDAEFILMDGCEGLHIWGTNWKAADGWPLPAHAQSLGLRRAHSSSLAPLSFPSSLLTSSPLLHHPPPPASLSFLPRYTMSERSPISLFLQAVPGLPQGVCGSEASDRKGIILDVDNMLALSERELRGLG